MSMKRSSGRVSSLGGGDAGGKVNREDLYADLVRRSKVDGTFSPADVALAIGAGESQVSRILLGLSAEGVVQKVELDRYAAGPVTQLGQAEFLKAFSRASKIDATRLRDLQEVERLKKNNDVMRARLLRAQAERDHYLSLLKQNGIDPGVVPENESLERAEQRARELQTETGAITAGPVTPSDGGAAEATAS